MAEETKPEGEVREEKEQEKPEETPESPKQETQVDRAERAVKELDEKIKYYEGLKDEVDKAKAEIILGGRSAAGQEAPKKKEETPLEYKNRVMRGDLQ